MNRATIELRLIKLNTLVNSINVSDDFTMSYNEYTHKFDTLKENLSNIEFAANKLLDNAPGWFEYYNEWYKALSKIYSKQYG